jgi:hypothetical protein
VRQQISIFVGPLHRHVKQVNTIWYHTHAPCRMVLVWLWSVSDMVWKHRRSVHFAVLRQFCPDILSSHWKPMYQRKPIYGKLWPRDLCESMAAQPHGECARAFRKVQREFILPSYQVIRRLILEYASDLAEKPPERCRRPSSPREWGVARRL